MSEFQCHACSQPVTVSDDQAGRDITCPQCGAAVTVPTDIPAPPMAYTITEPRKRSRGLAIAALLMGVSSLMLAVGSLSRRLELAPVCLALEGVAGLVAYILGIVSLATKRGAKILALAGVITGAAGIYLFTPMVLRNMANAYWRNDKLMSPEARCLGNLVKIGGAIEEYRDRDHQQPPADLKVFIPPRGFPLIPVKCPSSSNLSRLLDYFYFPRPPDAPREAIMACDFRDNHDGKGRSVLYAGGCVKFLSESEFQAELARPENAEFANALAEAEAEDP